jgi:hypothetical protein
MIATVVSVVPNVKKTSAKGSEYEVCEFTYQSDPYKGQQKPPTTRSVFMNDPCIPTILTLVAGDRVDLGFTKNGQYQNLTSVAKAGAAAPAAASTTQTASEVAGKTDVWAEKDLKIARAVALKAGVELTAAGATAAALKKPDVLASQIVALAEKFMPYLTLDDAGDLAMTEITETTDDFKEEKF